MNDRIQARGTVTIEVRDPEGNLTDRRISNAVTTAGREGIADNLLASPTLGKPTHMAVGEGSPAANALGNELDRKALESKTRDGATVTMIGDWAAGEAQGAVTEAGVFNDPTIGDMWLQTSFAVLNIGELGTLRIEWSLEIT